MPRRRDGIAAIRSLLYPSRDSWGTCSRFGRGASDTGLAGESRARPRDAPSGGYLDDGRTRPLPRLALLIRSDFSQL